MTCSDDRHEGEERRGSWRVEMSELHESMGEVRMCVVSVTEMQQRTHQLISDHIAEERETKAAIDELILLWRGSKLMVSAFKILIPIVAALVGGAMWVRDHVRW